MSLRLAISATLAFAAFAPMAKAGVVINSSVGGSPSGVILENFDSLPLGMGSGGTTPTGVTVSTVGNAGVVQGSQSGLYAAPFLTGGDGAGFGPGGTNQASGPDATPYLQAGNTSVSPGAQISITLPGEEKYVGLLWGSVDTFNTLSLYDGASLVTSINGSQVIAIANGNQGPDGTVYANVGIGATGATQFDRLVLSSSQYTFEVDDLAFNPAVVPMPDATPVPEPASLVLLASGLMGLGLLRRTRHI